MLFRSCLAHTPKSVIADNFHLSPEVFAHLPKGEKYIFRGSQPGSIEDERPKGKEVKKSKYNFTHRMLEQEPLRTRSGSVRITDSTVVPASTNIAAALVEVEPGGLRELHWHPNADEWQYYLEGQARMTVFASGGKARTFDYRAGDVGSVPFAMGHYIENTGPTTLRFLEVFKSDRFADVSLAQWLALTPPELVKAHLQVGDEFIAHLQKVKPVVV